MALTLSIILTVVLFSLMIFAVIFVTFSIHIAARGIAVLSTSRRSTRVVIDIFRSAKADTAVIYDLGCGKGGVTCALKKAFPTARIIGIDCDPIQILYARVSAYLLRQTIVFRRADLFSISIVDATCIYAFLPLTLMPAIESKLLRELNPGALIVTNAKQFSQLYPIASVGNFFVFRR